MPEPMHYIKHMRDILDGEVVPPTYEPLEDLISFDGFDWVMWLRDEKEVLQPRLKELGYSEIVWYQGEYDSFGPLTRVCKAVGPSGELHWLIYG